MSIFSKLVEYLRSSKHELTKVTWPSRQQTIRYSSMVIIISLSVAAFFGLMDYGLGKLMNATLVQHAVENYVPTEENQPIVPDTVPVDQGTSDQPVFEFDTADVNGGEVQVITDTPAEETAAEPTTDEQPTNENQ